MFLISIYSAAISVSDVVSCAMQPTRWTTTYSIGSFNSLSTYTNGLMVDIPHMLFTELFVRNATY